MNEYLVVVHRDITSKNPKPSAEQMQMAMKPYQEWIASIAAQDKLVAPPKRWDVGGRVIKGMKSMAKVSEGPLATENLSIGGLFLVKADDYKEAVKLAKACPIIQYGAIVEVREAIPPVQ